MTDIRKYNLRSIIIMVVGVLMLLWMFIGSQFNMPYCDDELLGPLGISLIIFGIARIFFRTFVQSAGRRIFGVWLIVFGGYCYINGVTFLPGVFGFLGGFIFIILGIVFLIVDF